MAPVARQSFRYGDWQAVAFAALLAAVATAALGEPEPRPSVTVLVLDARPVTSGLSFTGRVAAVEKVDVRARVSGFLKGQHFREGQDVQAGDLLFTIEEETYQALVNQRQADLSAAEAKATNAQTQLARAKELLPKQTISQATYDDRHAASLMADAAVLQAKASLAEAQINLGYTKTAAPISGRIGRAMFKHGALVGVESGALATVVSQDPIYVTFAVSQRQIMEVRKSLRGDKGGSRQAVVRLQLPDNSAYADAGKVDFTDVTVDRSTDTLAVRAVFPNEDRTLVDGQYVRVRIEDSQPQQAILVPQRSILNDQAGSYVFVLDAADKVQSKRLKLGATQGPDVVVQDGLAVGDRVVVDGIQKVRPGMTVDAAPSEPGKS